MISHESIVAYACLALSMSLVRGYVALSKPLVAALPRFLLAWLRFGGGLAMLPWLKNRPTEATAERPTQLAFPQIALGIFCFPSACCWSVDQRGGSRLIISRHPAAVAMMSWLFLRSVSPRVGG
jgi:hypothetical protein